MIRLSCFALVWQAAFAGTISEAICSYHPYGGASVAVAGESKCALPVLIEGEVPSMVTAEVGGWSVYVNGGYTASDGTGSAVARITSQDQFVISGPERDGWLWTNLFYQDERWDAYAEFAATINGQGAPMGIAMVPFRLGGTIDVLQRIEVGTIGGPQASSGSAWMSFEWVLYEADGVTPASFGIGGTTDQVHAPEPSALLLLSSGIGVFMGLAGWKKRANRRSH